MFLQVRHSVRSFLVAKYVERCSAPMMRAAAAATPDGTNFQTLNLLSVVSTQFREQAITLARRWFILM